MGTVPHGTGEASTAGSWSGCDSVCGSTFLLPLGRQGGAHEAEPVSPVCSPAPLWELQRGEAMAGSPSGVLGGRWRAAPAPEHCRGGVWLPGHGEGEDREVNPLPEGASSMESREASGPTLVCRRAGALRPGQAVGERELERAHRSQNGGNLVLFDRQALHSVPSARQRERGRERERF